jgi:iron complex outermembrane recepter protein
MKLDKLFQSLLLTSAITLTGCFAYALLLCTPAKGESVGEDIRETNINISQLTEVVSITGVVANPSDKGVEIILQTTQGKVLQPVTLALGKTYIANIPNAVLVLPQGKEFRSDNPASGITRVAVTQASANSIRVTVTGKQLYHKCSCMMLPMKG